MPDATLAVDTVLPPGDALDSPAFHSTDYVNVLFPSEQSLSSVDAVGRALQIRIRALDLDIQDILRQQTELGTPGTSDELQKTQATIEELFEQVVQIRNKSRDAEKVVQDLTKDIRSLDFAKRNLTMSIKILRRLQMLATAIDQLKALSIRKQYGEATLQLSQSFKTYKNVRQVADLLDALHFIQADLRKQIFDLFDSSFTNQGQIAGSPQTLAEACLVVDVVDPSVKTQLVDWYCSLILREYRSIFRINDEACFLPPVGLASLEHVPRRFAWLKRILKLFEDEHAAVFPKAWALNETLADRFCEDTKKGLGDVLARSTDLDIKLMLKMLRTTLEFENQLAQKFLAYPGAGLDEPSGSMSPRSLTAAGTKYAGTISTCFEPYLTHYIEGEDKNIATLFQGFEGKPLLTADDSYVEVLSSSTDIFMAYKDQLAQCSKLSVKQPLVDLSKVFGKWLSKYADFINAKLPKEDKKSYQKDDWKTMCMLLNTSEYCSSITAQLDEKLKARAHPDFTDKITLEPQREQFMSTVLNCVRALVKAFDTSFDPAFTLMSKMPWGTVQSVGDQSEYVTMMGNVVTEVMPTIQKGISNGKYFKTFCDKLADAFTSRLSATVLKCKPVSEVGAEQLLLDVHSIKTILLKLPTIGAEEPQPAPATYIKYVTKGIGKSESILKVLLTHSDPPEGLVETYLHMFPDKKLAMFQKILEIKNLKRNEQAAIMELFVTRVPTAQAELAALTSEKSFMSGIPSIPVNMPSMPAVSIGTKTFGGSGDSNASASSAAATALSSSSAGSILGTGATSTSTPTNSGAAGQSGKMLNENMKKMFAAISLKKSDGK
ncbi:Vacuolar protein sorting-associated protein 53 [Sorochytrium milnesiophthora]